MSYTFLIIVVVISVAILSIAAFSNFSLDNAHYDRLKWLVVRWHYITAFVALLVKLFGFPYGSETVLLVAGIGACMAGMLGISNANYPEDEALDFDDDDEGDEE